MVVPVNPDTGEYRKQNDSLNMLRICAMLMVVVLHIAQTSGMEQLVYAAEPLGRMYSDMWVAVSNVAVNVFALLTGYLCVDKKWNPARYFELLLQVCMYVLLVHVMMGVTGLGWDVLHLLIEMLPLTSRYWYFVAYTALFVLMPYLNRGLKGLSRSESLALAGSVLCVFSLFGWLGSDELAWRGHGFLWLCCLYVIGAHLRLHPIHPRRLALLGIYAVCCLAGYVMLHLGGGWEKYLFRHYPSPFTSVGSIAFFLMLVNIRIPGAWFRHLLAWAAPLSFGVYLVHTGCWVLLEEYMPRLAKASGYAWWFIPGVSLLVYAACTLVDYVRSVVFRRCGVRSLCKLLSSRLPAAFKRMQEW